MQLQTQRAWTISWDVSGPDAGKFDISETDGGLTFEAQPNFETPGDSNRDNVYEVTVVVSDPAGNSDELDVRVTVTDVMEDGDDNLLVASAEG